MRLTEREHDADFVVGAQTPQGFRSRINPVSVSFPNQLVIEDEAEANYIKHSMNCWSR
jgi:hypothetical protein